MRLYEAFTKQEKITLGYWFLMPGGSIIAWGWILLRIISHKMNKKRKGIPHANKYFKHNWSTNERQ